MTQASRVELQIGELVLHGVSPRDGEAVATAFTQELTRLLSEQGVPATLAALAGEAAFVEAGALDARPGMAPELLGAQAALAVYAGLGRAES